MNSALGKQNAHIIQKGPAVIRPSGRAGHQRNDILLPVRRTFSCIQKLHFYIYIYKKLTSEFQEE